MLFVLSLALITWSTRSCLNNFVTPSIDWMVMHLFLYWLDPGICCTMLAIGVGVSAIFTNQFAAFFHHAGTCSSSYGS
jgi:hypothetical protein